MDKMIMSGLKKKEEEEKARLGPGVHSTSGIISNYTESVIACHYAFGPSCRPAPTVAHLGQCF